MSYISENCEWNDYGPMSECSATCGGGVQHRERTKKQEAEHGGANCTGLAREESACNTHNCAGIYINLTEIIFQFQNYGSKYFS